MKTGTMTQAPASSQRRRRGSVSATFWVMPNRVLGRQPAGYAGTACVCWSVLVTLRERCLVAIGDSAAKVAGAACVHEHGHPSRLGVAVAFGVWIGCTPFYGFQTLLGLGLASLLRLNRLAVLLGLQISIPPLAPFLLFANAQLGALVLRGHWLPLSIEALRAVPTSKLVAELFGDLLVGGAIVGTVLAVPAGLLTTYLVRRRRRTAAVG